MTYQSRSFKLVQLLFYTLIIGTLGLLALTELPILSALYPRDLLWLGLIGAGLYTLQSLAKLKFHAWLVQSICISALLFFLGYYFSADQVIGRFDTLTQSHDWILWRTNLSNERHYTSWFFYLEATWVLSYGLFLWRIKTKDCAYH